MQTMIRIHENHECTEEILQLVQMELLPKAKLAFPGIQWNRAELLARLDKGRTYLYLHSNLIVAGFIHVVPSTSTLWIDMLAVHPVVRKKGIGTALIKHIEKEARQQKRIKKVCLFVDQSNSAAIRFYKRRGYFSEKKIEELRCYQFGKLLK